MCSPLTCTLACSAFYKKFVRPRVMAYFSAELEATEHFFFLADALCWAPGITSATIGYTLWNRQHKDDDLALTVLVALGAPHGGGEFAHAEHGYAHAVRNGAILVVNPLAVHGTAEFDYLRGDDMRIMVAFFVKSSVVKGMATGASHGRACGLAVPPACKPTHRGKGRASSPTP